MIASVIMYSRWRKRLSSLTHRSKDSSATNIIDFQNWSNQSPVASSAKFLSFKTSNSSSSTSKKHSNSLQINLSSKLANNSKLTSNKYKKWLNNDLCLYYGAESHKLDFYSKKQIIVSSKRHSISAAANPSITTSEKPSEK